MNPNPFSILIWLLCFVVVATSNALSADNANDGRRTPLWNGPAPIGGAASGQSTDANAWITVHHPNTPNGTAIVICPGGGYGRLVVDGEGHRIARWLNRHGITGVVLEYRLPAGRHAVPLLDAQRAIRTVRAKANDWKLDRNKIGIMGFSAGGHLASTAATHFDDGDNEADDSIQRVSCRPDFAILIYPVVTMGQQAHTGSKKNLLGTDPSPTLVRRYCNELQVTEKTPPTFLAHAVDDRVVPAEHSRALFDALQKQEISARYLELPSGGHGLNGYQGPMWDLWQQQSLAWISDLSL